MKVIYALGFILSVAAVTLFSPLANAHHTLARGLIPHCESNKAISIARCYTFVGASAGAFLMVQPNKFCEPLDNSVELAKQFVESYRRLVIEGADAATLKGLDVMYNVMETHYTCGAPTFWKEKKTPKVKVIPFNPNFPIANQAE